MGNPIRKLTVDNEEKGKFLQFLFEGYCEEEIKRLLNVKTWQIARWKTDPKFRDRYNQALSEGIRNLIYKNLRLSASGQVVEEVSREYVKEEIIGGEPTAVKVKEVKRQIPPDVRALTKLASKFAAELNEEVSPQLTIRITQKDRTLTLRERLAILEREKSDLIELSSENYREIEEQLGDGNSEDPPIKG